MKHRYDGHDDIMRVEPADIGLKLAERVQIAAAMGVGDAFRASRGARGEAEATRCGLWKVAPDDKESAAVASMFLYMDTKIAISKIGLLKQKCSGC